MVETARITVAETSRGAGASEPSRKPVSLPVVDVLTGRGFITGKSGSGKSNSASVIAEKLLDNGFGLFIVDVDGEYYGLKEEYEILHAGGDAECDVQVTVDHAERLASLALEENVPVILDVSSYVDDSRAEDILREVARHLFAKAKKRKQPFLLLVEEVHEYIPENGSVGECGKLLIKIGKRGRKHGLGICGISQRPADVKKDFITQCDWLLWHRLTWNNDTKVVRRILDGEYASAVENLADGEGFLMTDWAGDVRRVQFYRKRTFDAGATPGLDDFERPDLKSVSADLVAELQEIDDEREATASRIDELESDLAAKDERIADLETELERAREVSDVAEQFVDALTEFVPDPGGQSARGQHRQRHPTARSPEYDDNGHETDVYEVNNGTDDPSQNRERTERSESTASQPSPGTSPASGTDSAEAGDSQDGDGSFGDAFAATFDTSGSAEESDTPDTETTSTSASASKSESGGDADGFAGWSDSDWSGREMDSPEPSTDADRGEWSDAEGPVPETEFSADVILSDLNSAPEGPVVDRSGSRSRAEREDIENSLRFDVDFDSDAAGRRSDDAANSGTESGSGTGSDTARLSLDGGNASSASTETYTEMPPAVEAVEREIDSLHQKAREMLAVYREDGPVTPVNAHFATGGDGDRTMAYAHNRELRSKGFIEHVGRGHYEYRLPEYLTAKIDDGVDPMSVEAYKRQIESAIAGE